MIHPYSPLLRPPEGRFHQTGSGLTGADPARAAWITKPPQVDPGQAAAKERAGDHPCPRDEGGVRWLIRHYVPAGWTVLDPFAGSGTTLRAAWLEGRSAVGIELNPRWAVQAAELLRALWAQRTFDLQREDSDGRTFAEEAP